MTRNFDFSQAPGVGITVLPDLTTLPNVNDVLSVQAVTGGAVFTRFLKPTLITLANLPTSNAGLSPGTLWNNGGFVCVA